MDNSFMMMGAQDPTYRKQAFRPAEPLAEHVVASLGFVKRVASVELTGGDKKKFDFVVQLHANPQDAESKAASFKISRSIDDVEKLHKLAVDACCRHVDMSAYDLPSCALCEPFKELPPLRVSTKDRMFNSKEKIQKTVENFVASVTRGAAVPPTNADLFCEGVTRLPAAVTKFLLRGVDQTKL